jgi:hypothetical protein
MARLLQIQSRYPKVNLTNKIKLLKRKGYSLFVFCDIATLIIVINNEWEEWWMCQHVCNWRAKGTDKAKTDVGCRPEYEFLSSLLDVCEIAPPSSTVLFPHTCEMDIILVSRQ